MTLHRDRVRVEKRGDIAYVSLARPDKHNALDWDMLNALVEAAREVERDRSLRGVLLFGEGPSFCSGLDFPRFLKEPSRLLRAFAKLNPAGTNLFQQACWAYRELPVPVVAAIHGRCYGGGIQLALAADIRVAAPEAELSVMEAKWGLVPDMTGTVTLRELMPMDQAKLLTMTGRTFTGDEARGYNLVTQVSDDPMGAAEAILAEIATRSPDSVSATKRLFHQTWDASVGKAFAIESALQTVLLAGKNQKEAVKANFEKRAAKFGRRSRAI